MADTPPEDRREPGDSDELAKLELPSLRLPRLGRRRRRAEEPAVQEPTVQQPSTPPAEVEPPQAEQPDVREPEAAPARFETQDVPAQAPPPFEAELTTAYSPEVTRPAADSDGASPEPATSPVPGLDRAPTATHEQTLTQTEVETAEPDQEPARARRSRSLPTLSGRAAAAVTGLLVGLFGVLATVVSLKGCDVVRGADTCGGPGVLVLIVILVLMILLGGLVLAVWGVPEPRSTSFLAVGVLSVVMMLTLMEEVYSTWMIVVVPVLCAASYVLAHWVTTTFVEPAPEKGPEHDVR